LADEDGALDFFYDGVNAWEGEDVFDSYGINLSIVGDGSVTAILLLDVEDWGSIGGLRFMNETSGKLFLYVLVLVFFLSFGQWVDFTRDG
jgi:hypothetical protein